MGERPYLVDDVILARIVGRDVRHHQDARLAPAARAVDESGDRRALVRARALQPRGNQITRAEEPGRVPFERAQCPERLERPAPPPQLTADRVDPPRGGA